VNLNHLEQELAEALFEGWTEVAIWAKMDWVDWVGVMGVVVTVAEVAAAVVGEADVGTNVKERAWLRRACSIRFHFCSASGQ
jgi:hypothetical protein